jgi:Asp-tRNA(Asn)/Glu-tRNA(Gln) amidotransferase C subunit
MSTLNVSTVKKILIDARLDSNPSESVIKVYENEFKNIIDNFTHLATAKVSTTDLLKRSNHFLTLDLLREDVAVEKSQDYIRLQKNILDNAPHSKNNLFIVDGIFE